MAFVPPRMDGGDEDGSAGSAATDGGAGSAGTDGGAGSAATGGGAGDAGPLTGDLCTSYLSGISCEVQEIAISKDVVLCARFADGAVRCKPFDDTTDPDSIPFIPLAAAATQLDGNLYRHFCALQANNEVACWTDDGSDTRVISFGAGMIEQASALSFGQDCARVDGDLRCSRGSGSVATLNLGQRKFVDLSTAQPDLPGRFLYNQCAVTDAGEVLCWGNLNTFGSLGTNDREPREPSGALTPVPLSGSPEVVSVATAFETTCVVLANGGLRCWGSNSYGQLGLVGVAGLGANAGEIETLEDLPIPPVRSVSVSPATTCALSTNGTVRCWGRNQYGQLGLGDAMSRPGQGGAFRIDRALPIDLGTGRRALQVVASDSRTCALLDDHSVKCWGGGVGNAPGEMGDSLPRVNLGTLSLAGLEALGPEVTVTAPPETDDTVASIHTGDTLNVLCLVEPSTETGQSVDDATVVVRIRADGAADIEIETYAQRSSGNVFSATVNGLGGLVTGAYTVECAASDTAERVHTGHDRVRILHDSGPALSITAPMADAVVGQAGLLLIDLQVSPAPLVAGDTASEVVSQRLIIAGVEIPLVESTTEPGRFSAEVDFLGGGFQPPPSGTVTIRLESTNVRGRTSTLLQNILVDGVGPIVAVQGTSYDNGDIIRGSQVMLLTVTDTPAGVDPALVYGRINTTVFPFVLTTGNTYRGVFDSLAFDRTVSQLTVEIHAFDRVGNETIEPRTLQLDNQPPIVSLDSPPVREYKGTSQMLQCSVPFDPLGSDTASDGSILPEGAEFRARVEDQTNGVPGSGPLGGGIVRIFAGVNPTGVDLVLLTDLTRPLLIDTDGDQICDEINDELSAISGTSEFQTLSLRAIPPKGTSLYTTDALSLQGATPLWAVGCHGAMTEPTMPPALVCEPASGSSMLTRVIKAPLAGILPAIWGLPGGTDTLACAGHYWDWQLPIPDGGPACVAVRAVDNLNNVGVSQPMRVCLQRSSGPNPFDCNADLSWRDHDCLSGTYGQQQVTCTPPPDFQAGYVRAD